MVSVPDATHHKLNRYSTALVTGVRILVGVVARLDEAAEKGRRFPPPIGRPDMRTVPARVGLLGFGATLAL